MSSHVTSWVLKHSEARLGNRLVLLALADHAHADGSSAYPTVGLLAREARLSERQVQNALRALEKDGAIEHTGTMPDSRRIYRVIMEGAKSAGGEESGTAGVQNRTDSIPDFAPEPSEPSKEPSGPYTRRRVQEAWLGEENLIQHRDSYFADRGLQARVAKAVDKYGLDDVLAAIKAYAAVLRSDTHFFSYSWPLADFLKRGLDRFVPEAKPLEAFRASGKAGRVKKPRERIYTRA
jgi:DNA-binding Lrp family transcriptional regulator